MTYNPELKHVSFPDAHGKPAPYHGATYCLFGDKCVFTTLYSSLRYKVDPSTIAAERIIAAIAAQEQIEPDSLTYFDLQTRLGYPFLQAGDCILNHLSLT